MKNIRSRASVALVSLLLAACGGASDEVSSGPGSGTPTTPGTFNAVVSFGDSLSDVGAYAPATSLGGDGQAPYFGGKFTTNTVPAAATGTVWVENVAAALNVLITPHEVGFGAASLKCPAAANAALAGTCTAYAQGGARVSDPSGIGKSRGALTVPMSLQIANHLTRFTSFKSSDLIFVYGGNNDVLIQFNVYAETAAQIQSQSTRGAITPHQALRAMSDAQNIAEGEIQRAALELSGYVRSEILAKGGKYVAVMNLPDSALTPFGGSQPGNVRPMLTRLVDTFNLALREGLSGQAVLWIDANAAARAVYDHPGDFGITNVTTPACDADKIAALTDGQVTDGSSLFCNSTPGASYNGVRAGADAGAWLFADSLHPTTGGHKLISDNIMLQLRAAGWVR